MIKKLDPIKHTENLYDKNGFITNVACGGVVIKKVNELIDAVNELRKDVLFLRKKVLELGYKEPEPAENVQDKFAEQRKWIGKLCKFWDIDNNNLYYGPLTKIHDTSPYCYECNHKMCYAFCEPVKDDIIYKGDGNE